MKVEAIKTRLVHAGEITLNDLLAESIETLPENSIVVISSKIAALCENRVVKKSQTSMEDLIKRESEMYLDSDYSEYGHQFTINGSTLVQRAGIDRSNIGGDFYALWPSDLFGTTNSARKFLREKFQLKNLGVILLDSVSSPMRRGVKGEMIAWSGFLPVNNYIGETDLAGRTFEIEMSGVGTSLAIAANIVMGEGAERQPIGIITEADFVQFVDHDPTREEKELAFVPYDQDIFMPFLKDMPWQKGGNYDRMIVSAKNREDSPEFL